MYVESFKNNGIDYLQLVKSIRVLNSKGIKTARKKVVYNIGPLSKFDDGKPEYVKRLKKSFKAGKPIISSLEKFCDKENLPFVHRFNILEGSPDCFGNPKIFSNILLERILEEIGLRNLFSSYKGFTKIKYDVYGFAKLLIFGRLLNPTSKSSTIKQNDNYYVPILNNFNPDNVYDTLDFIFENKNKIIKRINTNLVKKANRSTKIIYYDVTNFYFEIENPDEDILDENDNIIKKGIRKNGVCKEERKLPIVQMGLFMDDNGYTKVNDNFKYKSRIVKRSVKDEQNVNHTIEEKVVVYWSKKFQERAEKENKSFLDFIKKLQNAPESFRLTSLQNKSIQKFLKKEYINKNTGEILNSSDIKPMLDFDKIKAYTKSLGYYQIVTSELNMEENEVIDKYHGLRQIEEQFRTMKSTL